MKRVEEKLHIVKILISGAVSVAKSEFIGAVSEVGVITGDNTVVDGYSGTKERATAAMDTGRFTVDDDLVIYLYGTRGREQFSVVRYILSKGITGLVVMVDSARPQTFLHGRRIIDYFNEATGNSLPYVVAVIESYKAGFTAETVKYILSLPRSVPVLPCVPTDEEQVKNVLLELCERTFDAVDVKGSRLTLTR